MVESKSRNTIGLTWEPKLPSFSSPSSAASPQKLAWKADGELIDGLFVPPNDPRKINKLIRSQRKETTGGSWFDMLAPTITPEIKNDLQILKLRSVLDPKRHYKKSDLKSKTLPKFFQVGTVIESASDFFSGRLTKKERKNTLAEELLSDTKLGKYRKRKVREIEEQKRPVGVDKWKIKGRQSYKRAKDRRFTHMICSIDCRVIIFDLLDHPTRVQCKVDLMFQLKKSVNLLCVNFISYHDFVY